MVVINGMAGRVLADPKLRKAVQYIIYNFFKKKYVEYKDKINVYFTEGVQFYPYLYPGHMDDEKAERIIDQGKIYIEDLRKAAKSKPIQCVSRKSFTFDYCDALAEYNIKVITKTAEFAEIKNILYKSFDADLVGMSASYASADPDGIYHFLGRNGAIWSPLSSRPKVEKFIEEGRVIVDKKTLDEYYKKVAAIILEEVPVIHLGIQKLYLIYNVDTLKPIENISARRKALNVTLFQWR
jgi:ABC-type transport system substrate-binding protein